MIREKVAVRSAVDRAAGELVGLSTELHTRPETAWEEHHAAATVPDLLDRRGFTVTPAYLGLRALAAEGITLVGMTREFAAGRMRFAPDLRDNITGGDTNYLSMLDEADAYVARNGLDLPEEPAARTFGADPECVTAPLSELDLAGAGVTSIVWATGFASDYGWLPVDAVDDDGRPRHARGVSTEPGIYFLGLPWQSRRGSSFIWGVWHDAAYVADHIAIQRGYLAHHDERTITTTGAA